MGRYDDSAGAHAHPRFKLFQPTTMVIDRTMTRAHLLDLSVNGALVHAASAPVVGQMVQLECAGRMRMARVAWAAQSRFGVVFVVPLSDDQVAGALDERASVVARHAARLGAVA